MIKTGIILCIVALVAALVLYDGVRDTLQAFAEGRRGMGWWGVTLLSMVAVLTGAVGHHVIREVLAWAE